MKRITVTLTEDQMWELRYKVYNSIDRLKKALVEKPHPTTEKELAFQKRLYNDLAKGQKLELIK